MTYVPVLADLDIDDPQDLVDLELAQVSLLRMAERHQRAAVHGWGCPPLTVHVGLTTAGTTTVHLVLPVPPSTFDLEVQITGAGDGLVVLTTPYGSLTGRTSADEPTFSLGLLPVEGALTSGFGNGPRREWRYMECTLAITPQKLSGGPDDATVDSITLIPVLDVDGTWGTTWHASFGGPSRSVIAATGADRLTATGPQTVYNQTAFSASAWVSVGASPSGVIWALGQTASDRGVVLSLTTTGLRLRLTNSSGTDTIVRDYAMTWGASDVWRHIAVTVTPGDTGGCVVWVNGVALTPTDVTDSPADIGDTMEVLAVGASTTGTNAHGLRLHHLAFLRGGLLTADAVELYDGGDAIDPRATSVGGRVTDAWCADLALGGTTSTVKIPNLGLQPTCTQLEGSTDTGISTAAP